MKSRNGFVSNSSSSSFMCLSCGEIESGMDLCLSDAGMMECVHGHIFHQSCIKKVDPAIDLSEESCYEVDEEKCPFCTMKSISDHDLLQFLKLQSSFTSDQEVIAKVKELYGTLENFHTDLKTNSKIQAWG